MSIQFQGDKGSIEVSHEVVGKIVGVAVSEVYGVVGMTSKTRLKDGIMELLKQDNYQKGISVEKKDENDLVINVYIVVLYGTKISEIATNIQEKAKFQLEQSLGINVSRINVFVEDVSVPK